MITLFLPEITIRHWNDIAKGTPNNAFFKKIPHDQSESETESDSMQIEWPERQIKVYDRYAIIL